MSFDDIPEDMAESYPCPHCEEGSVAQRDDGVWECNSCDFYFDSVNQIGGGG